jgi:hypothetical protein
MTVEIARWSSGPEAPVRLEDAEEVEQLSVRP